MDDRGSGVLSTSRRRFIGCGLAAAAAMTGAPGLSQYQHAAWADEVEGLGEVSTSIKPDRRILVVVQLSGGNDGLNTVVPYGSREYYYARPNLSIAKRHVHRLRQSEQIGLHPELEGLKDMMESGLAAVVQGVGNPKPDRSHATSLRAWHTASVPGNAKGVSTGWLGRALEVLRQTPGPDTADPPSISFGGEAPLALIGQEMSPLVVKKPTECVWSGSELNDVLKTCYEDLMLRTVGQDTDATKHPGAAEYVSNIAAEMRSYTDRFQSASFNDTTVNFPGGALADKLRTVINLIRAGFSTRVYYVTVNGFDTHANQVEAHAQSLWHMIVAFKAFYNELQTSKMDHQVLTLAFSEFGRRVEQNASNGTDHGTAGPVFLFGRMVRPGLVGSHPSLTELDQGDLVHTIDFRSIYAAILDQWMGIDHPIVLGGSFKPANIFR